MKRVTSVFFYLFLFSITYAQITIKDISGHFISSHDLKGKYMLFLVFDPSNLAHRISLMYAQVLSKKFNSFPLSIVGISTGDIKKTVEAKRLCGISFPLTLEKPEIFINKNLTSCCGATIMLDPDQRIIFKDNDLLQPDLLKQLLLRQLNIEEQLYQEPIVWNPPFLKGDYFNDFSILELADGKTKKLSNKLKKLNLLTFFSSFSFCSTCKQFSRLETLHKIASHNYRDLLIAVFFLEPFTAEDIFSIKSHRELVFDTFLVQNFMPDENIYITDYRLKCDPWTIIIDSNRFVVWTEFPGLSENKIEGEIIKIIKDYFEGKNENKGEFSDSAKCNRNFGRPFYDSDRLRPKRFLNWPSNSIR